jgi:hypothetical protein
MNVPLQVAAAFLFVATPALADLAEASVAVPFVGAAAAALTIAQASRLASLQPIPHLMQVELGATEMVTNGGLAPGPETNLGSFSIRL